MKDGGVNPYTMSDDIAVHRQHSLGDCMVLECRQEKICARQRNDTAAYASGGNKANNGEQMSPKNAKEKVSAQQDPKNQTLHGPQPATYTAHYVAATSSSDGWVGWRSKETKTRPLWPVRETSETNE